MKIIDKIFEWYFTKNALPYWVILAIDIFICYVSGILVFWFYYHGAVDFSNLSILTKTIFGSVLKPSCKSILLSA